MLFKLQSKQTQKHFANKISLELKRLTVALLNERTRWYYLIVRRALYEKIKRIRGREESVKYITRADERNDNWRCITFF